MSAPEVCPRCGNRDRDLLTCDGSTHRCLACGYDGSVPAAAPEPEYEYRVVDGEGEEFERWEGSQAASSAEFHRDRQDERNPDEGPFTMQRRTVGAWVPAAAPEPELCPACGHPIERHVRSGCTRRLNEPPSGCLDCEAMWAGVSMAVPAAAPERDAIQDFRDYCDAVPGPPAKFSERCPTCGSTDRADRPFVSYHYGPCANAWHSVEEGGK